jgi:hypothetical protein
MATGVCASADRKQEAGEVIALKSLRAGLLATTFAEVVVVSVLAPISAAADHTRLVGSFSFTDPTICIAPIRVAESFDEQMHTFYDKNGNAVRLSFTGKVNVTYANLNTGATYSPNSSGPGTIDLQSGQTVLRGGNGAFFDSNGVLVATDGRIVLDASGNVISMVGHENNVCDELGSTPAP